MEVHLTHFLLIFISLCIFYLSNLSKVVNAQNNDSKTIEEPLQTFLQSGILNTGQEKDYLFKNNVLSKESVSLIQNFLPKLKCDKPCQQCLSAGQLDQYFDNKIFTSFVYTSKVLLLLTLEASKLCNTAMDLCRNVSCVDKTLENHFFHFHAMDESHKNSKELTNEQLHDMFGHIKVHYIPDNNIVKCLNENQVMSEASNMSNNISTLESESRQLGIIYAILARHLLAGNCIGTDDTTDAHLNDVFKLYGNNAESTKNNTWQQIINETGFINFMQDINNLPGLCQHTLDHAHNHQNDHGHDNHDHSHDHHDHSHDPVDTGHHDHDHHNHSHEEEHTHHPHKRHIPHKEDEPKEAILVKNATKQCTDWTILFENLDLDHSHDLNEQEMFDACPTIINHWAGNFADRAKKDNHDHHNHETCGINCDSSLKAKAYGYGTLAVAIISLCSIAGILIIPCMNTVVYKYAIITLIAMGFGILTGDAILHLIPQAFGLHEVFHSHAEEGHSHDSGHSHEGNEVPAYILKSLALLGAIYGLFLFEGLSNVFLPEHHHHHQSEAPKTQREYGTNPDRKNAISLKAYSNNHKTISRETLTGHSDNHQYPVYENGLSGSVEELPTELASTAPVICCGLKSLSLVILLGDTIHNFADGLVIGAAFASGIEGGISSSLAIFCHELPHEFGDFAILLSTGLSKQKVLIFNLLSSLSAFIGLYIGLILGSDEATVQWIMAVTAGMFLFVALGDMMPELKVLRTKRPWLSLLFQNFGVLLGFGFIILLSFFEHDIHI